MRERERDDPPLKMRAEDWASVGAGAPDVQRLQAPRLDLALEAIVGRAMHAHQPARLRDVAQLIGQREQTHAIATSTSRSVTTLLSLHVLADTGSVSKRPDGPPDWEAVQHQDP